MKTATARRSHGVRAAFVILSGVAPRFDPASRTLKLAVADLLDAQLLRSLGFANRGGYERMWLGQAIHSRYQEEALAEDSTYQHEVHVEHTFDHRGWQVTIQGRIDGIRRQNDGTLVIEEIKSVRRGANLSPAQQELYERQAALYAWLLREKEGIAGATYKGTTKKIEVELVLIEIGSDFVDRQPVKVHYEGLGASIRRRLNLLIRGFRNEEKARAARRETAADLVFPHGQPRPGQTEVIDAVRLAMDNSEHLLVEAPTGLGKTAASLYPVLRYALANDKRVFVLTAKTLQQDLAMEVLRLLNDDESFRALRLRAKSKMCANDQVLCHEEYCDYARDYYLKLQQSSVVPILHDRYATLYPEDIYSHAQRAKVCPFEVSLELTGRSQVAVCDYNYAFDPYVALTDFSSEADLDNTILVIDEIHNLVARGRGYYSPQLSSEAARKAGEMMNLGAADIHGRLAGLCFEIENLIIDTVSYFQPGNGETSWAYEEALPEDEIWRLRPRLDAAFVEYLEYRRETRTLTADDQFVDLYFALLKFLNGLMVADGAFSKFLQRDGNDYLLRVFCKDPSRFLGGVINRCHSVVGLSATLSPPEFYRDLLGFDPARTDVLQVENPFPVENRQVVIDNTIATTWRERPLYYPVIADRLAAFADAVPGNCLALFPSYKFLAEVSARIRPQKKRVLVQSPGDGDRQRDDILETLRSAIFGDVLLLAVAGGVFAEGVDYPGDMLKAVAVVGPCLPAVTLEIELLQAYYEERFERGFEYAFVVPGMTRVVQAAGRLIRSPEDTGVIALLDQRFLRRPYKAHLPAHWLPPGGVRHLIGDPDEVARLFFVPTSASIQ